MRQRKHNDQHDGILQGQIIAALANSKSIKLAKRRARPLMKSIPSLSKVRLHKEEDKKEYVRARTGAQKILKEMLKEKKRIDKMCTLHQYVTIYSGCYKPLLRLDEIRGIYEDRAFNGKTRIKFDELLAYCIVEYFRNDVVSKRKRIRRCKMPECQAYFISKKRSGIILYCPDCSPKNKYPKEIRRDYDAQRTLNKLKSKFETMMREKYEQDKRDKMTDVKAKDNAIMIADDYLDDWEKKFKRYVPELKQFIQSFDPVKFRCGTLHRGSAKEAQPINSRS